jgi:ubiquinol-cytochrome c reductase cytochrome c subunit
MGRLPLLHARRRRRGRKIEAVLVLGVLAAAMTLTATTWARETPRAASVSAAAAPATGVSARQENVDKGRRIFLRDCAFCHGDHCDGTALGPQLLEVGTADVHFQLSTGRMPLESTETEPTVGPPSYPPSVIDAIVAYTDTFITGGPPVPEPEPGDLTRGRSLFLYNCAPCHSSSGTGMILPAGAFAPELFDSTSQEVAEAIRIGPGPMPVFPESELDKEQMDAIVTYVQQLGDDQDIGGHPLDFFGPIAEGIVFWLIPLPLLVIFIIMLGKKAPK